MSIKAVLFDLDGTLLPMDQDVFVKKYFGLLAKKLAPYGYEPQRLFDTIWAGTAAMVKNDGCKYNEQVFWEVFTSVYGEAAREHIPVFDEFYSVDFDAVQGVCGYDKRASETVALVKSLGFRVALATNPFFPEAATRCRVRWAGLEYGDFELVTVYENSTFCKPDLKYYEQVISKLGVKSNECLMVGNDVGEDMIAEKLGMKVFLLTDNIINKENADTSRYPQGGFDELVQFIRGLDI